MTGQIGKDANFKSDYHTDDYNFEAYKPKNSRDEGLVYCKNDSGVEIDGFLFFPESVEADESYARREYTRTKIMSGGEFVTRGQYVPKAFNFKTSLDIDPAMPTMYDKVFEVMENKPCEVLSPYMGDLFLAEVTIQKTHPKASPHTLELEIKVKEIANPKTRTIGDAVIEYPSTTSVSPFFTVNPLTVISAFFLNSSSHIIFPSSCIVPIVFKYVFAFDCIVIVAPTPSPFTAIV